MNGHEVKKKDPMVRVRIQGNARVMCKDTRLPGNVVILLSTRGSTYIHGIIVERSAQRFPGVSNRNAETPSTTNIFNIREKNERELLDDTQAQAFHHAVVQLLFTGIWCSKDAHMSIAFLTM